MGALYISNFGSETSSPVLRCMMIGLK